MEECIVAEVEVNPDEVEMCPNPAKKSRKSKQPAIFLFFQQCFRPRLHGDSMTKNGGSMRIHHSVFTVFT